MSMRAKMSSSPLLLTPLEKKHGALPELRVADIVLVRHKKILMRSFLRRATESYWDHVALVLFPKDPKKGYSTHLMIEAIQYGLNSSIKRGIEIHRLDKYLLDPDRYEVGIKRFTWLHNDVRERVRAFALMNVDAPYYPLSTSKFLIAAISKRFRRRLMRRQRYSCSALVQKAFYEAADWSIRTNVIFREPGLTPIEIQEMASPADIANSPVTDWIYNKH
jgi:hypothetical protein